MKKILLLLQKSLRKSLRNFCSLNSEIEELAEDAENVEEIYDGCLQSEVNITKKINTLKSLVDKEKGLIKDSNSKPESFKPKFVNLPKLTIEKFKGDNTKFNTFMDSFVAEKFSYLHSFLEGEAFRTIQGVKSTDKNYPELLNMKKVKRDLQIV